MMKSVAIVTILFAFALVSCKNEEKVPDVSKIKAPLQLQHFEQDFFSLDTINLDTSLQQLHEKYPEFMQAYVFQILSGQTQDFELAKRDVKAFISSYKGIYDSSRSIANNLDKEIATLKKGLQYTKHYFPKYQVPTNVLTFIAPLDAPFMFTDNSISGSMRIGNTFGIGLQLYLGNTFSVYKSTTFQEKYPGFVARRFSKEYIPVNCIKLLVDDIYPANLKGKSLIEQMVEVGKRMYVLDKLLPEVEDTLKIGYTKAQLDGVYANESVIWGHFITQNNLYTTDPNIIKDYMNDGPNTTVLGPASPGFIGQFVGWQIVKKWMEENDKSLEEMLKTPAKQLFEESKYKPS
jgi:hypothetical protein